MDLDKLEQICLVDDAWFETLGGDSHSTPGGGILRHIENGGSILGVAYIGTAGDEEPFFSKVEKTGQVWASGLRQRLGAHILLNELPARGIDVDVLLAGDDAAGMPLAEMFFTVMEYSWMFSFDLQGSGVCLYQYEDKELLKVLLGCGFVNRDDREYAAVDDLWFLGIRGLNFGNGILGEGKYAQALARITDRQLTRFARFYRRMQDTELAYDAAIIDDEELALYEYGANVYDFSSTNQFLDACDLCETILPAEELIRIRMIGDGVFLCPDCAGKAEFRDVA